MTTDRLTGSDRARERLEQFDAHEKQKNRTAGASMHLHSIASRHRGDNIGTMPRTQSFWNSLAEDMEHVEWMLGLWAAELAEEGEKCQCEHPGYDLEFRPMLYKDKDGWEIGNNARSIVTKAQRIRHKVRGILSKKGWA